MHKAYLTHLQNSFLDGSDYYLLTLHKAYNILQCCEPEGGSIAIEDDGVTFVNAGGETGEGTGHSHDNIVCFECRQPGHFANQCPNRDQSEAGAGHKSVHQRSGGD